MLTAKQQINILHQLMSKTIVITNAKGGTGKSRYTGAAGSILASMGYKVLLMDLNPQADLTRVFTSQDLLEEFTDIANTMYAVYANKESIPVYATEVENVYIAPAHERLQNLTEELSDLEAAECILKEQIELIKDKFDYILIDTTNFLGGILTRSAYAASDGVIIVTSPGASETHGIDMVYHLITEMMDRYSANINILGGVLNKYEGRANPASRDTENDLASHELYGRFFHAYKAQEDGKEVNLINGALLIPFSQSDTTSSSGKVDKDSFTYDPTSVFSRGVLKSINKLILA